MTPFKSQVHAGHNKNKIVLLYSKDLEEILFYRRREALNLDNPRYVAEDVQHEILFQLLKLRLKG